MFKAILSTILIVAATSASAWTHSETLIFPVATYQTDDGEVYVPLNASYNAVLAAAVEGNDNATLTAYALSSDDADSLFGVSPTTAEFLGTYANDLDYVVSAIDGQWVAAGNVYIDPRLAAMIAKLTEVVTTTNWLKADPSATFPLTDRQAEYGLKGTSFSRFANNNCADAIEYLTNYISWGFGSADDTRAKTCDRAIELHANRYIPSDWDNFWAGIGDICLGAGTKCGDTVSEAIDRLDDFPADFPFTPAGVVVLMFNEAARTTDVNVRFTNDFTSSVIGH